jgi:hypothetical protein
MIDRKGDCRQQNKRGRYQKRGVPEPAFPIRYSHRFCPDLLPFVLPRSGCSVSRLCQFCMSCPISAANLSAASLALGDVTRGGTRWLKRYLPLVQEGSWGYLEIHDSDLFKQPRPKDIVASAFVNLETCLVLANYGNDELTVETAGSYRIPGESSPPATTWRLPSRSLQMLQRARYFPLQN